MVKNKHISRSNSSICRIFITNNYNTLNRSIVIV
jgi:hypothetical protein